MDKQCADQFDKADKYLLNCPTNTTMCRKIVQDGMLLDDRVLPTNIKFLL